MVLGIRSKLRRGASVEVNYIIHVQEIKPWPPSQSLKTVHTVLLQWENGNQNSGSFTSTVQDSKIVFNESFKLPLILYRDKRSKDKFQKNYLEFSLFVPRKEKVKGQLIGTALVNLADYGVIEDNLTVNALLNLKKGTDNSSLVIRLELDEKDKDNDNDLEIASFTDDDEDDGDNDDDGASSYSTGGLSTLSSPSKLEKRSYGNAVVDTEQKFYDRSVTSVKSNSENPVVLRSSASSINYRDINDGQSTSGVNFSHERVPHYSEEVISNKERAIGQNTSVPSISYRDLDDKRGTSGENVVQEYVSHNSEEVIANKEHTTVQSTQQFVEENRMGGVESEVASADSVMKNPNTSGLSKLLHSATIKEKDLLPEDADMDEQRVDATNDDDVLDINEDGSAHKIVEGMKHFQKKKLTQKLSKGPSRKQVAVILPPPRSNAQWERAKSARAQGKLKGNKYLPETRSGEKAVDPDIHDESEGNSKLHSATEREPEAELPESKSEWKTRVENLEEELREAAAIEVGLYSVVAEHASSGNKVHAPARRLSRFYSDAFKSGRRNTRASAARAAISGLVVVSKSCGNDVPRLTFWLSNSIMLRSIISHMVAELPHSNGLLGKTKATAPESRDHMEREESKPNEESNESEDVSSFIIALEKVESWLFSRIVESLWWQIFTPHMQSTVAKGSSVTSNLGSSISCGRRNSLRSQDLQGDFSTELWKKAFKDACERLCPNRAGGHECGCLFVLIRLVMEQLVNRLDVAMFNAILRESTEEMPTDPLSDPITECKVLPVPVGKSSFGAGVALKNAIGNWSRWLTDLFDLELEDESSRGANRSKPYKAFHLLHALSDLMMLPFGMLADASTRKEVCPMFGPTIIRRVLTSFVPDEFSPDPIPQDIIDALDSQEVTDDSSLTGYPCSATPTKYSPPPAALLTCVGEVGKQVLVSSRLPSLQKSYTSDDELDELDSPFTSIIPETSALAIAKEKGARKVYRYELLRKIWNDA